MDYLVFHWSNQRKSDITITNVRDKTKGQFWLFKCSLGKVQTYFLAFIEHFVFEFKVKALIRYYYIWYFSANVLRYKNRLKGSDIYSHFKSRYCHRDFQSNIHFYEVRVCNGAKNYISDLLCLNKPIAEALTFTMTLTTKLFIVDWPQAEKAVIHCCAPHMNLLTPLFFFFFLYASRWQPTAIEWSRSVKP